MGTIVFIFIWLHLQARRKWLGYICINLNRRSADSFETVLTSFLFKNVYDAYKRQS